MVHHKARKDEKKLDHQSPVKMRIEKEIGVIHKPHLTILLIVMKEDDRGGDDLQKIKRKITGGILLYRRCHRFQHSFV